MEALKTLLGQVDDDYLTGLSNKGTVKRAYKDLEKETPVLTWQEESAQVALKEETCVIRVPLGESSCSWRGKRQKAGRNPRKGRLRKEEKRKPLKGRLSKERKRNLLRGRLRKEKKRNSPKGRLR